MFDYPLAKAYVVSLGVGGPVAGSGDHKVGRGGGYTGSYEGRILSRRGSFLLWPPAFSLPENQTTQSLQISASLKPCAHVWAELLYCRSMEKLLVSL